MQRYFAEINRRQVEKNPTIFSGLGAKKLGFHVVLCNLYMIFLRLLYPDELLFALVVCRYV